MHTFVYIAMRRCKSSRPSAWFLVGLPKVTVNKNNLAHGRPHVSFVKRVKYHSLNRVQLFSLCYLRAGHYSRVSPKRVDLRNTPSLLTPYGQTRNMVNSELRSLFHRTKVVNLVLLVLTITVNPLLWSI